MNHVAIPWPSQEIADFCRRCVLVAFTPGASWSLLDHVQMEQELSAILGRGVDLVSKRAVERSTNWIRRQAILGSAEVMYAAG